ncbi:MAG: sigma-70 family RNA polymerase sigma factor [Veillonellales bacterium]
MDDLFPVGDDQIVDSLKRGAKNGVELLLTQYGRRIVFIATKKHGLSLEDAEELMTDVIMEVAKKIDVFDPSKGSLRSWIGSIAHRRAIDLYRKKGKKLIEQTMTDDWWSLIGQSGDSPDHESGLSLDARLKERIESTLALLSDREKELLRLRAEDLSLDEIALMLDIEKNAVSVAHYRAKQHFKKLWETTDLQIVHGSVGV